MNLAIYFTWSLALDCSQFQYKFKKPQEGGFLIINHSRQGLMAWNLVMMNFIQGCLWKWYFRMLTKDFWSKILKDLRRNMKSWQNSFCGCKFKLSRTLLPAEIMFSGHTSRNNGATTENLLIPNTEYKCLPDLLRMLQGFIQAILMFGRRHKKVDLLIEL